MENKGPELIFDKVRLLDSGGQADVHLLRLRATGGIYAGKFLREAWDPVAREEFRKEAERQARVAGEHVVPIVTWNMEAVTPFVVMPYMPGGSLAKEIERRGGLSVAEAIDTTYKVAVALADLHGRNVIHRDLKPGNVLVDADGRLRLSDLGIAATMTFNEFVRARGFVGTEGYAAPEQYQGFALPQSDVYALGKILRQLVLSRTEGLNISLVQQALLLAERFSMTDWRHRPTAREAINLLTQLMSGTAKNAVSTTPQPASDGKRAAVMLLSGIAGIALASFFGGGTSWDPGVERYRGKDGRFSRK